MTGTIKSQSYFTNQWNKRWRYRVEYEDNDSEDLDEFEITQHKRKSDGNDVTPPTNSTPSSSLSSPRSKQKQTEEDTTAATTTTRKRARRQCSTQHITNGDNKINGNETNNLSGSTEGQVNTRNGDRRSPSRHSRRRIHEEDDDEEEQDNSNSNSKSPRKREKYSVRDEYLKEQYAAAEVLD